MKNKQTINLQYTTIKKPLPDFIWKGLRSFSDEANIYQPQPVKLVEKLAKKHGLEKSMIFLTAGADEAIQMFAEAFGQNAFVFVPTYVVYSDVEEFGGKLTRIFSIKDNKFSVSVEKIESASLIYLANPNNPSGFTEKKKVIELVNNNPNTIVVIDEAYGGFADLSVVDKITKCSNLAVLRSFSKDYGMAGNRVGYIAAQPELIEKVKNKTQWANVSYLSVGAASTALDHEKYFSEMRKEIAIIREDFYNFLKVHQFRVFPSKINALLIKFKDGGGAGSFVDFLHKHGIVVSHGNGASNIGLDDSYVRIAIGTKDQMENVKQVISEYKKT